MNSLRALPFVALTLLWTGVARAEQATIQQSVVIRAERTLVSLKPGTVVELLKRDGAKATIRYRNITTEIPAAKLEAPAGAATADTPPASAENVAPSRPPQSIPGKAVQKARDVVKQKERNDAESVPPEMAK